ncbi:4Fe-4S ferredoxin [Litchfieldella qijiaojingensis]|uniref:4Fe-4S ferredoxin n=1 Tax=Litchfieldella qijiaojingensis TaxID=980347 RepID=A0ABQ2YDM4_9GAMM|nr:4Fe-4S binding protein [Halomonas qijiaojingensis]GGX78737.1 4Fe-4S ferredoxin [Halomonas qijiaojingensis]
MNQRINLMPVDDPRNRHARECARRQVSWPVNLTPASVSYSSQGHTLILGNERCARRAARALREAGLPSPTLLYTEPTPSTGAIPVDDDKQDERLLHDTGDLNSQTLSPAQARDLRIDGYLGRFTASLVRDGSLLDLAKALTGREHFDLVLDLGTTPILALELSPPGYVRASHDNGTLDSAVEELAGLVGEFDKPRYFQINQDLCAHASSGNTGCTRCLEVCPADAIASHQERIEAWIEIDPFRCHGIGSCTSACPTGAIQFRLPETQRQQDTLLAWLAAYREAGGSTPVVRFGEAEDLASEEDSAGHVLDIPLEELGAAGHDQWLTALAGGAAEVRIQYRADMPERLVAFLDDQLAQAQALLEAMGHAKERIKRIEAGDNIARDALPSHPPLDSKPLAFDTTSKRERLNGVLACLLECGTPDGYRHSMPSGAAYGGLDVDTDACTLCMACVANCPTPALAAGDDHPLLSFREADCVQCGLCVHACPEDAIALAPGFLADNAREQRRVCHEEAPFECIHCGKPFATASTIANIKAKLADHPYFAGQAMARLEMCEDCRVRDVWQELAHDPESQLKV